MDRKISDAELMRQARPAVRALTAITMLVLLAGCSGIGIGWPGSTSSVPAEPQPVQPSAPPVNLSGLWTLDSPGHGQCRMTLGAAAAAGAEGTIAPQGGCPGKFYMSRKWTYDAAGLTIKDHTGKPLAQLTSEGGNFQGQATGGEPVTLMR